MCFIFAGERVLVPTYHIHTRHNLYQEKVEVLVSEVAWWVYALITLACWAKWRWRKGCLLL